MAKQTFTTGQVLTAAQMTSLQQTAMGGGSATAKTASYTLAAADAGATIIMNAAGTTAITVNTSLFSAGDTVFIQNIGAGVSTITAGTATVSTAGSLALAQYDSGTLYFTATGASIFSKFGGGGAAAGGLTYINTVSFSGSTGVNVNDVFSTTYDNYRIVLLGTVSTATVSMRLRVSGTDTSTGYEYVRLYVSGGSVGTDTDVVGNDEWFLGSFDTTNQSLSTYDIASPFLAEKTAIYGGGGNVNLNTMNINAGNQTDATSFTGFSILCVNGMTGKVAIYGYPK